MAKKNGYTKERLNKKQIGHNCGVICCEYAEAIVKNN